MPDKRGLPLPKQTSPGGEHNVRSSSRGRGVGRQLGEYALQWAKDEGFRAMQFNAVVDTNTTAIRLWEELGFETVGIVPEAFDSTEHGLVALRVMYRRL